MTQWQTIKLGELAEVSRGSTITRKEVFPGEVPVIAGGQTPSCYHNVSNRQGKTITVSASGAYAGYVQYFEIPIFASDCSTIKIKDENMTSSKFLFYMLLASQTEIYAFQRGSGQPHVYPSQLVGLDIPTPTIDEQHKIVELLEDHLSRLDAALADVKQAKIKAAQFRRSLLQAAFTGNLDYDGASLFAEWQTKTIGEIADTQLGKMLNKGKQTGENTVPYLRSVNVQWGRVDTSDLNQMDILPSELAKFTVKKGDLLICEGGESGRVAIWDREEPIGFQNALHRVRAKSEVTNKYLYYYFEWLVKNQLIEHLFNGVTIKHFPQENLRSVEVSYPAIDEQRVIVEHLEGHLSRLDASVSLADAMEKQSNGLRRSLLQSAFTGQLTKEVVNV